MFAVAACASAPPDASEPSEDELRTPAVTATQLPGLAAIRLTSPTSASAGGTPTSGARTIGATAKITKALSAIQKRAANAPTPKCSSAGKRASLQFVDAHGAAIASADTACGIGALTLPDGSHVSISTAASFDAVFAAPLVPADVLWGVTKIEVARQSGGGPAAPIPDKRTLTAKSDIDKVLGAFDAQHAADASVNTPFCMPAGALTFCRGEDAVADVTYSCAAITPTPAVMGAAITGYDVIDGSRWEALDGAVKLDTRVVDALFAAPSPPP